MKYGVGSTNFMAVSERDTTVTSCLGDHEAGQIGCTTPCRFPNRPVQAVETETPPRSASSHAADTASPSWMGKPASPARCKAVTTTFEIASSESDELRSIGSATFVPVAAIVHGTREAHQEARAYAASRRVSGKRRIFRIIRRSPLGLELIARPQVSMSDFRNFVLRPPRGFSANLLSWVGNTPVQKQLLFEKPQYLYIRSLARYPAAGLSAEKVRY